MFLNQKNYHPFGLKHEGYNAQPGNASYTYQCNSKELQRETGWNDYGARMYMSDIGRWGVVDPLAETSRRYTPYNYALNNPVRFIDPDGRKALPPDQDRQLNIPVNGFAFYFASGGSGRTKAIQRFFGPGDGLGEFFNMDNADEGGGGGNSVAFCNTAAYVALMSGETSNITNVNGRLQWYTLDRPENAMYHDFDGLLTGATGGVTFHSLKVGNDNSTS